MQSIPSSIFRADLRTILDEVDRGAVVVVTRHGDDLAIMIPLKEAAQEHVGAEDRQKLRKFIGLLVAGGASE